MKPLEPPDSFHFRAAQGWRELGNLVEANAELEKIAPQLRAHADVLKLRWKICADAKKWEAALDIATALIELVPEEPFGWVHQSLCLHELKRTQEALERLLSVVDRFPRVQTIHFNLACYECRLGRLDQAINWLEKAFKLGNARELKLDALEDPDLEPLWKQIEET